MRFLKWLKMVKSRLLDALLLLDRSLASVLHSCFGFVFRIDLKRWFKVNKTVRGRKAQICLQIDK
jgi:hypothetical protein